MSDVVEGRGMGWLPDYPDFRDFTVETTQLSGNQQQSGQKDSVRAMLDKTGVTKAGAVRLPPSKDLREWCSPVEDQGQLGSCTAHAGVGMIEYYELRAFKKHIDASRLFLYWASRKLLGLQGDTGAYLRTTMGAMVLFGAPPEKYWPYQIPSFDTEPPVFCFSLAQDFRAVSYFRLDPPQSSPAVLLDVIKRLLAAGIPSMFGFTVYSSISQARATGKIPYPTGGESVVGGHAIMAVGYDDSMEVKNANPSGVQTKGALLIRNSWGSGWGDKGYGWLPYEYVLKSLARDWWSLLKNEWIDTGVFSL